jgi:hypothetical protein
MEAQLGDLAYFGNGIAYYTGPMGMGTFYLYDDTLYIGGDVSLWNQERGGYDNQKVWTSPQLWGELFEDASHESDSYGLVPLLEGSDYTTYNVGFPMGMPPPAGAAASLIKDKNGNWYAAFGVGVGEAVPLSLNVSHGFLTDSEVDVEKFLTGYACNVNMGLGPGIGYTWNNISNPGALEVGLYTPQFGASCMYAIELSRLFR